VSALNPKLVVHECKYKIDGITKYIEDYEFYFDNVFKENQSTEEVYNYSVSPSVKMIINRGIVTCFAYGQTGSGKTYTMKGIQNLVIDSLYKAARNQ
jgi:kinesin family protein 2/24